MVESKHPSLSTTALPPRHPRVLEAEMSVGELVGREVKPCGGKRLRRLHPLRSSSVMAARTGNQSTAALSAHAIGPAPATMNGLSTAFYIATLFNNKFGNVWISSLDHIPVQWCSQRAVATPLCFVNHKPLGPVGGGNLRDSDAQQRQQRSQTDHCQADGPLRLPERPDRRHHQGKAGLRRRGRSSAVPQQGPWQLTSLARRPRSLDGTPTVMATGRATQVSPVDIFRIVVPLFQFADHVTSFHNVLPLGIVGRQEQRPRPARIVRSRQWCEMAPCLEGEVCSLLFNRSGWTCTRGSGRIKTVTTVAIFL
eukprot:superscaffoldBa00000667_g6450